MNALYSWLALTTLCQSVPSLAPNASPVRAVRLTAYSFSASTWFGVDTVNIHYSAPLTARLRQPKQFVAQLKQALAKRDTIPLHFFKEDFVRFCFTVSYRGGGTQSIYLALGSSLLWGHRLYALDQELKELIRQHIPAKDDYLPLRRRH